MRYGSGLHRGMGRPPFGQHLISDVPVHVAPRDEVDRPAEQPLLARSSDPRSPTRASRRDELVQQVDVARRGEIIAQNRSEQVEPGDALLPADAGQTLLVDLETVANRHAITC